MTNIDLLKILKNKKYGTKTVKTIEKIEIQN